MNNLPDNVTLADIDGAPPDGCCIVCRDDLYEDEGHTHDGDRYCPECYDRAREQNGQKCYHCCEFHDRPLTIFRGHHACPNCITAEQLTIEYLVRMGQYNPLALDRPIIITLAADPDQHYEVHEAYVAARQLHVSLKPVTPDDWALIEEATKEL